MTGDQEKWHGTDRNSYFEACGKLHGYALQGQSPSFEWKRPCSLINVDHCTLSRILV